jgi:hypothetical protein
MKFKKIVGFGDSWMYGHDLIDPNSTDPADHKVYREANCFLGQLGAHYNVPVENFGISGGSLQSSIWTCLWWMENETLDLSDCLVLIGLTESHRSSFYNNSHKKKPEDAPWDRFVHSTWDGARVHSTEFYDFMRQHFVLTACDNLSKLNYQQAVYFFDGIAAGNDISLFQFNIFDTKYVKTIKTAPTLIWTDTNLHDEIILNPDKSLTMWTHPSKLGHKVIADRLISEIDSSIL